MNRIGCDIESGVATLRFQRDEVRNALNRELFVEFHALLDQMQRKDSGVRALVLTGSGSAFCSGIDLRSVDLSTPESRQTAHFAIRKMLDPLIARLSEYRYPIVSAVNGPAVGAGMSLALATDIIVTVPAAYFLPSFLTMGLVPDAGIVYHLARRIGGGRALSTLMLAKKISAVTAFDWGMVHEVIPADSLLSRAVALAHQLAAGPALAISSLRLLHASAFTATIQDFLAKEKLLQMDCLETGECVEGVRAFFEKRVPQFYK